MHCPAKLLQKHLTIVLAWTLFLPHDFPMCAFVPHMWAARTTVVNPTPGTAPHIVLLLLLLLGQGKAVSNMH
jgi:hypothetical protein